MDNLVSLEALKRRLRIFHDDDDADLTDIVSQAQDVILNYINKADATWTETSVPPLIQAAILFQAGLMWTNRGDAEPNYAQADGYLDRRITSILYRYRKPVSA